MSFAFVSSIPKPDYCCENMYVRNGAGIAFSPRTIPQQTPLPVVQLLGRAGRVGTHVGTLCNLIYSQQGEVGVRRILGVLSLAKKYGTAAVDEACAAALEMGVHEYRFVRRYLERCPQAHPVCARSIP